MCVVFSFLLLEDILCCVRCEVKTLRFFSCLCPLHSLLLILRTPQSQTRIQISDLFSVNYLKPLHLFPFLSFLVTTSFQVPTLFVVVQPTLVPQNIYSTRRRGTSAGSGWLQRRDRAINVASEGNADYGTWFLKLCGPERVLAGGV